MVQSCFSFLTQLQNYRWRLAAVLLCGLSFAQVSTPVAAQQITGEVLLEEIVEDYGPKYADVETAIEYLRGGKVAEAREALATARRKNPDLPPANLMLAQILFRLKQVQPAQTALEEAVKEDPKDPGAYIYLGEVALQSRRWTEAGMLYDKGLQLANQYSANPKRKNRLIVSAYSGQVSMAELQEDWAKARQILDTLLKVDPNNSLALTRMGRVMFKMSSSGDDVKKVLEIFKKLHANDENTAHPYVNMGLLFQQSNDRDRAKRMMEEAAKGDGNNARTRLAVAKWALDNNEMAMAKENAEAALRLNPDSLDAKLYLGLVARFNNELPKAEEAFKEAHLQSPTHLGAITQLALVLVEQSDERKRAQALDYARLNTQLYSDLNDASGREAAVTLGWVLSRLGQNAAATRAIQQALSAGNGRISADSAYHAAQILYDSGMTEASQKLLEQTLQSESVFPNRSSAELLLAKIKNR